MLVALGFVIYFILGAVVIGTIKGLGIRFFKDDLFGNDPGLEIFAAIFWPAMFIIGVLALIGYVLWLALRRVAKFVEGKPIDD